MDDAGIQELTQMRENIRRMRSLELCWGCERICECEEGIVDDAAPVWLCGECQRRVSVGVRYVGKASLHRS